MALTVSPRGDQLYPVLGMWSYLETWSLETELLVIQRGHYLGLKGSLRAAVHVLGGEEEGDMRLMQMEVGTGGLQPKAKNDCRPRS